MVTQKFNLAFSLLTVARSRRLVPGCTRHTQLQQHQHHVHHLLVVGHSTMINDKHWLYDCQDDLSYLEELLTSSFGPIGRHALLLTGSKQALCSSRGMDILDTWRPKHPIVVLAVKAALAYGKQQGGGTKRVLLMVLAGLRAAGKLTLESSVMYMPSSIAGLCHALEAVKSWQTDLAAKVADSLHMGLLANMKQHMLPVTASTKAIEANIQDDHTPGNSIVDAPDGSAGLQRRMLCAAINTHLTNRASRHVTRRVLSPLITDLLLTTVNHCLTKRSQTGDPGAACQTAAWIKALHKLSSHPPIHILPGQPVEASKLVHGILLHSSFLDPRMPKLLQGAGCIVMTCSMVPKPQPTVDNILMQLLVSSAEQYHDALLYNERYLHAVLHKLSSCGVSLIVCTEPCSEPYTNMCSSFGMSVIAPVDKEDALAIINVTNTYPITSTTALLRLDDNTVKSDHVSHVNKVREVAVAGLPGAPGHQRGVLLHVPDGPPFLQLAGPSDGVCRQYRHLVIDCLKLLNSSFQHGKQGLVRYHVGSKATGHRDAGQQQSEEEVHDSYKQLHLSAMPNLAPDDTAVGPAKAGTCSQDEHESDILARFKLIPSGCAWSAQMTSLLQQQLQAIKYGKSFRRQDYSANRDIEELEPICNSKNSTNTVPHNETTLSHADEAPCCNTAIQGDGDSTGDNASHILPASSLLPAYQVLHAMAAAVPAAMLQSNTDMHESSLKTAKVPGRLTAHQLLEKLLTQPCWSKLSTEAQETSGSAVGLVCPSQSFHKHGKLFKSYTKDAHRHVDQLQLHGHQDMLIVANPASYGVIEPVHHVLGIWNAATALMMQLLRTDMIVSSRRLRLQKSFLTDAMTHTKESDSMSDTDCDSD